MLRDIVFAGFQGEQARDMDALRKRHGGVYAGYIWEER